MEHHVWQLDPITAVPTREMSGQALFTIPNSFFFFFFAKACHATVHISSDRLSNQSHSHSVLSCANLHILISAISDSTISLLNQNCASRPAVLLMYSLSRNNVKGLIIYSTLLCMFRKKQKTKNRSAPNWFQSYNQCQKILSQTKRNHTYYLPWNACICTGSPLNMVGLEVSIVLLLSKFDLLRQYWSPVSDRSLMCLYKNLRIKFSWMSVTSFSKLFLITFSSASPT